MRKALLKSTILIIILLFSFQLNAQIEKQAIQATKMFYQYSGIKSTPIDYTIIDIDKTNKLIGFNFKSEGWIIIKYNASHQILAFSEEGILDTNQNFLTKGRKQQKGVISSTIKNIVNSLNFDTLSSKRGTTDIDAFLTDTWGGINCFDESGSNIYPSNHYTPIHCSPGCVAISNSQILHYYEWPIIGVGNNTYKDYYTDRSGNTTLRRHTQHFDNHNYDWANMLDEYQGVNSTTVEQEAVGLLMYDMGVAVEMNYEDPGSTSNLLYIPKVLRNYFRFTGTYHSKAWSSFWSKLRESMEQLRPAPMAVEYSVNGDGHVIVVDGLIGSGDSEMFHTNWGMYNLHGNNGWYNLRAGGDIGGGGYDTILGVIFDMLPEPQITSITPTGTGNDFVLNWEVSNKLNWSEFTLEQKVDQESDWTEIASGITQKNYTVTNPTGDVYMFRVKAKSEGRYYDHSWSEREIYAVSGAYNGYASFGGTQQCRARQTTNTDIDFTGNYTMETWLRVKDGNQNSDVIFDQNTVFGLTIENVTATDYSIKFKSHSSGLSITSSGSKPLLNEWIHIAVSNASGNVKLFIDGVQQASASGGYNLTASNNALNFGEKYHGGYSSFIVADMDQIRFSSTGRYSSDFTPDQATDFIVDTDTKAYFKFQNIHRNRLKDEAFKISVIADSDYVFWKLDTDSTASINQQELNDILKVYPNPTLDYITVDYFKNGIFNLEDLIFSIFDITGKQVIKTSVNSVNNKIDLTNLAKGTYFLKVFGKDFSATQKIIKQ